ncbi:MAG: hypothetical protein E4H08_09035, partial [Candidatus Atribacteria bacterium]
MVSLCNAGTRDVGGMEKDTVARRRLHWQRSGFHLDSDTQVAETCTGDIVAYAAVKDTVGTLARIHGDFQVHREHDSVMLRDRLLGWLEHRARASVLHAPEGARVMLTHNVLAHDEARKQDLLRRGYELVHHTLRMRMALSEAPVDSIPEGILLRSAARSACHFENHS